MTAAAASGSAPSLSQANISPDADRPLRRAILSPAPRHSLAVSATPMSGSASCSSCVRCRSSVVVSASAVSPIRPLSGCSNASSTAASSGSTSECSASIASSTDSALGLRVSLVRSAGQMIASSAVWCMCSWCLNVSQPARTAARRAGSGRSANAAALASLVRSLRNALCAATIIVRSASPVPCRAASVPVAMGVTPSVCVLL
jgi:hypothetical protein